MVNGNINSRWYINVIIEPHVQPYENRVGPHFVLQHDTARAQAALVVVNHLTQQRIAVLNWPACSPDLNPIEHLWDQLNRRVYGWVTDNTTLAQLANIAHQESQTIPVQWVHRLIQSMTSRVAECRRTKGWYTHY